MVAISVAKLIKTKSDDGLFEIKDGTLLGKEYFVDLNSRRVVRGYNIAHKVEWKREIINLIDGELCYGWIPTELLEIERCFTE